MNDHDYSHISSAFESLPDEVRTNYDDSYFAEFEIDKRAHELSTSADHRDLTDQLVRSAVSRGPPDLLICVTSITSYLSLMTIQGLPIDLVLKVMRATARTLRRLGILSAERNS
jgi:hypothetical protein